MSPNTPKKISASTTGADEKTSPSGAADKAEAYGATASLNNPTEQVGPTTPEASPPKPEDSRPHSEKSKLRFPAVGILFLLAVFLIVGIYIAYTSLQKGFNNKPASEPNVQRILAKGTVVVGTDATFPPMENLDANGNIVGYDVDLGKRIAEELNIKAEFRNVVWDNIFDDLAKGKVDIVMSSVSITDERKLKYDFSEPYLNAGQVIITRKDTTSISSTKDLQGKRIAVQEGTTNEQQAEKYTAKELVLKYGDFIDATNALLNGKADAIFSDLTGAKGIVDKNPSLKIASDPFTSEYYGIVFRKGEEDLVTKVNLVLETLRQRGVLVLLKQKWLE